MTVYTAPNAESTASSACSTIQALICVRRLADRSLRRADTMATVTVHLVGGFLGSGKTTAIRSACELLRQRGEAASVITNDQGTLLVDTAYLRGSQPTREVTGGCFCCRYDQLAELLAQARCDGTQHVFAEAVGSCADLVATVVRPLLGSVSGPVDRVSFTAMVDARLLIRLRAGEPLPWSGDVAYLFHEQLREAPLLVASKWDLVTDPHSLSASGNGSGIPGHGQAVLCQDGRTPAGVAGWVDALCDSGHPATAKAGACDLGIDYARYGAGEEALAWLDAEVQVNSAEGGCPRSRRPPGAHGRRRSQRQRRTRSAT